MGRWESGLSVGESVPLPFLHAPPHPPSWAFFATQAVGRVPIASCCLTKAKTQMPLLHSQGSNCP